MKFKIRHGLGGGYGGCGEWETIEARNLEDAEEHAYEAACDDFSMYGLGDDAIAAAEEEGGEFDADEIYAECRDSWIDWECKPWSEEQEAKEEQERIAYRARVRGQRILRLKAEIADLERGLEVKRQDLTKRLEEQKRYDA